MSNNLKEKLTKEKDWKGLNEGQKQFCNEVLEGRNCFLSGSAGVGKSFVVKFLFSFLEKNNISFGKTATTGVAALNIGGSTINSWAGIGLANTDFNDIRKNVFRNKKAIARIGYAKLLFLDEISMCSGELLDILDRIFRSVRGIKSPFGGIQVVFVGDFMQLPPIIKDLSLQDKHFAFESTAWGEAKIKPIILTKLIRQDEDSKFAKLLNELRVGDISNISLLEERVNAKIETKNDVRPAKLLGYNKAVENFNNKVLSNLYGDLKTFWAIDSGEKHHIEYFNKNCPAPKKLELKIGAQVMLLRNVNIEDGLVNGSLGVISGFEDKCPVVKFNNGLSHIVEKEDWEIKEQVVKDDTIKYKVVARRTQIPLKLAWAFSIHKSQGLTLDAAKIDLNQAFEAGMGYVSLSRVRNMESLSLTPFDPAKIRVNQKCLDFYKNLK